MATAFRRRSGKYVGHLDDDELTIVIMLMEQTLELLAVAQDPQTHGPKPTQSESDEFEQLIRSAGLSDAELSQTELSEADRASRASEPPRDPALRRLLPDGNLADPQAADEFRRLTSKGLAERKADRITRAIAALRAGVQPRSGRVSAYRQRIELDHDGAETVMIALTDVRLVLGQRLELQTESDADDVVETLAATLDPADPRLAMAFAYDFLTWLQESLAQALME